MSGAATHPMVEAARRLGPTIQACSDRIETERQLPADLVAALTEAEIFQMYQPRSIGGPEVDPLTAFAVAEELARADGSVGWCAQVSAAVTVFLAWLDPEALAEMAATTADPLHVAGSARPLGTAVRAEGGFQVKGRWNYASGVRHANWFLATSFIDGETNPGGAPTTRSMLLPVAEGEIVANWEVMGMRGTGSDDFVVDDVFVPRGRTGATHWVDQRTEPLYDTRLAMVATWAPTAGVAVGLAQGALDALIALADVSSTGSPVPLGQRGQVQQAVAEAEAITGAARAFCHEAIGDAWRAAVNDDPDIDRAAARAQIAITHAMNEAVRVADRCFHAAGTNAISSANRLERFLRDTHTAVQHAAGQSVHLRMAARSLLGLDHGAPPARAATGPSPPRP